MGHSLPATSQSCAGEGFKDSRLSILVIDDQPSVLKMITKMLHDLNYFRVIEEAKDGETAWAKIKKNRSNQYDIIITDIYMPLLDGMGLISRCLKSPFARDIPFLVITGETKPEVLAALSELGVRDCIVKPFSSKLFEDRINMILQRMKDPMEKFFTELSSLIDEDDYHDAYAKLALLDENEASKPKWLNLRGEILLGMGELDKARVCIDRALTFCESYLGALCNRAELEKQSGNVPAAIESLEKADAISPLVVERKISLGDLLFQAERDEDARKMLNKAASITHDYETRIQIAEMLQEKGFDKDVDKIVKRIMSFRDTTVEVYNKIGINLRKLKKYGDAERTYMTALNYYPNNAALYYNLGILYLYRSEVSPACECFEKALIHNRDFSDAQEMLAITSSIMSEKQVSPVKSYPKEIDEA